jgi:hypothetical protein
VTLTSRDLVTLVLKQKQNGSFLYNIIERNRSSMLSKFRDAWNSLKSMSKSQASKEYIQQVTDIKQKNNIENQVRYYDSPISLILISF